jgi:hypothetical protein
MNRVEDELFADFCVAIGVDNIRQYEDRELQVWQMLKPVSQCFIVLVLLGARGEGSEETGV